MSRAGRRVFLTGATGFIGSRLALRLAERGDRLVCFARASSNTNVLEALGAEIVTGDLTHGDLLARAMDGCDLAFHLAAIYDLGIVDAKALERTNVHGTRAFFGAVEQSGVPRAIYTSTTVALGPVAEGTVGDENSRNEGPFRSVYERTKTEAHRLALEAQAAGLPVIIVMPAYVYGPDDHGPGGRFIEDLRRGRVPGLASNAGSFSYVFVDDVVAGLIAAADRGRLGESYVLGGEHATVNEFADRVCKLAGKRGAPRLRFPTPMVKLTALALDPLSRLTGFRSSINRENVATTTGLRWLHSHDKATRELGYAPRSLNQGLQETLAR